MVPGNESMSIRPEFEPATVIGRRGGLPLRGELPRARKGSPALPARASVSPLPAPALDQTLPPRASGTASAGPHGFEGPPDAAKAADTVCVGKAGAGMIAALALGVPAFWIAFAASLLLGNSLLAALLTGWSIGTLAALAIPLCALLPSTAAQRQGGEDERVARPRPPRRPPHALR